VPTVDPYSFTAHGQPWVVQSWLASVLYAVTERVAGGAGLRVLTAGLMVAITGLVWRLARPAQGLLVRLAVAGLALFVGSGLWTERPFLIGLVALGLTMLVAEGGLDPRWLLPIGWVWVNSHGSFPLGIVYLVVLLVGTRLDGSPTAVEARALRWLTAGTLLASLNPLGPRLLLFPVELLQKQDVLRNVSEWKSPTFLSMSQRFFLLELLIVVVALVRRPSYRAGLVVAVFAGAALLGARNLTVASLVFVPMLATAWSDLGEMRCQARNSLARLGALLAVVSIGVVGAVRLATPDFDMGRYPMASLAYLAGAGVDRATVRIAHPEVVGNLRELLDGSSANVFYDDRFDMFPREVTEAHLALTSGTAGYRQALDRSRVDIVLERRTDAVVQTLTADPGWRVLFAEDDWVLFCRRTASIGGELGDC
jgi:hypothetical protein